MNDATEFTEKGKGADLAILTGYVERSRATAEDCDAPGFVFEDISRAEERLSFLNACHDATERTDVRVLSFGPERSRLTAADLERIARAEV